LLEFSARNDICRRLPNSWGRPPVKLQPAKILTGTPHLLKSVSLFGWLYEKR
jgi:hypothetical protein